MTASLFSTAAAAVSPPCRQSLLILILLFILFSLLTFGTVASQSTDSAATCNSEQANSCRQAVLDGKLDQLLGSGECLAKQYVHFSHLCTVNNYLPSVDFCCCQHEDRLLCCRYHQDWNHFRCKHDDDVIDNITMRWLAPEMLMPAAIGIGCIVVCLCLCYGGRCWCYHYEDDDEVWCCGCGCCCCCSRCCCSDENKASSADESHCPHPSTSVSDVMRLRPSTDLHLFCHRPSTLSFTSSTVLPLAAPSLALPPGSSRGAEAASCGVYGCPSCEMQPPRGPSPSYARRCPAASYGHRRPPPPSTLEPTAPPLQFMSNDDLLLLHQHPHSHPHPQHHNHHHHHPQPHLCPCSSASRCLFIAYSMQEGIESTPKCLLHGVPRSAVDSDPLRPTTLLVQQLYSSSCSCSRSPPNPHPPPSPLPDNNWKNVGVTAPPLFSSATPHHPTNASQMHSIHSSGTGQPPVAASSPATTTQPPVDNSRPVTSLESTAASGSPSTPPRDLELTVNEEKATNTLTEGHTDTLTVGQTH